LMRTHQLHGGSVVAIRGIEPQDVQRHGVVQVDCSSKSSSKRAMRLTGLIEKPSQAEAPSRLGIFGRYVLEPVIWEAVARTEPDAHGEVQLTDALNLLCQTRSVYGHCFDGRHYDAGDPIGYLKANVELSLQDPDLRHGLQDYFSSLVS
jgi:UTP--glucose-1-phosphate uridylyltransferase